MSPLYPPTTSLAARNYDKVRAITITVDGMEATTYTMYNTLDGKNVTNINQPGIYIFQLLITSDSRISVQAKAML